MKSAASIVYRDLEASPALNDTILKRLEKMFRLSDRLSIQRVVITAPHQHHHKGSEFEVSLEMNQDGKPINLRHSDDNVHVAVRDVFDSAQRVVKEQSAKVRSKRQIDKHPVVNEDNAEVQDDILDQSA